MAVRRRRGAGRRRPARGRSRALSALTLIAAFAVAAGASGDWRAWLQDLLNGGTAPRAERATLSGPARILDGDTLQIADARIRLFGVDAPESAQSCTLRGISWPCGDAATAALRQKIALSPVSCTHRDTDRYGRVVAECYAKGENLNAWMVRSGWAVAYRSYGGSIYDAEEGEARAAKRGIWAGTFEMPWDWRQGSR